MKKYYLSINKKLLANLMEQTLICPIYDSLQKDTPIDQRKYGNLILQNEKKYINNDDCILKIVLNDEEIKNLNKSKISQDIYIYI